MRRCLVLICGSLSSLALALSVANADGPARLVKNINLGGDPDASSRPGRFVDLGGVVLFAAGDPEHGRELWVTDGTANGTHLLKDIGPGDRDGLPDFADSGGKQPAVMNGVAYFCAYGDEYPGALWRSDGTAEGTYKLRDVEASWLTPVNGTLFFLGGGFSDLWKSDGTRAGTLRVRELLANRVDPSPTAVGDTLFFARASDYSPETGLWVSDGTEAGTRQIAALPLRNRDAGSDTHLIAVGKLLFFINEDPASGAELWRSDGTAAGTFQLADINPGPASAFYHSDAPDEFVPAWASLGTTLLFVATDGSRGLELWRSDGTAAGTRIVTEIAPGPGGLAGLPADYSESYESSVQIAAVGERVILTARPDDTTLALWTSDGTAAGTTQVASLGSRYVSTLVASGTAAFFTTSDHALWSSDGTAAGTTRHRGFRFLPWPIEPALGGVMMGADDGIAGQEPWYSDGTTEGTQMIADLMQPEGGSAPRELADLSGTLLFSAFDPSRGRELWRSDATADGTVLVKDINPGTGDSTPETFTAAGPYAYFAADDGVHGIELWRTDGSADGTALVADINSGAASAAPRRLAALGDTLYFFADDGVHGRELWRTDGTPAGTRLLKDINPEGEGDSSSIVARNTIARLGDRLYFAADHPASGVELWRTDGTEAGTELVRDLEPLEGSSYPRALRAVQGSLLFVGYLSETSSEGVYRSDGTASGTTLVQGIGSLGVRVEPAAVGDQLYFEANSRLWVSDGTAIGTGPIGGLPRTSTDALVGAGDSAFALMGGLLVRTDTGVLGSAPDGGFHNLRAVANRLVFTAGSDFVESLWTSDGSDDEPVLLQTADTPPARGYPPGAESPFFTAAGDHVFFAAEFGPEGPELWALPVASLPEVVAAPPRPTLPVDCSELSPADRCTMISAGTASGRPGERVALSFTLRALGEEVAGVQVDVDFLDVLSVPANGPGPRAMPRCTVNPAIDKDATAYAYQPPLCTPGVDCSGIRALVFSFDNVDGIPDEAELFSCEVDIAADAAPGTYAVPLSNAGASDRSGTAVDIDSKDGEVIVSKHGEVSVPVAGNSTGGALLGGGGCAVAPGDASGALWLIVIATVAIVPRRSRWRR